MINEKKYFSVKEIADLLHISRVAVLKKIQKGQIKAEKSGRRYIILQEDFTEIAKKELTDKMKTEIKNAVQRVLKEYGDTIRMLGKD